MSSYTSTGAECPIDGTKLYETSSMDESDIIVCSRCGADYSNIFPAEEPEELREIARSYVVVLKDSAEEARFKLEGLEKLIESAKERGLLQDCV